MNKISSIFFKDKPVQIIKNAQENVEYICLIDICKILKREEMIRDGKAVALCPSSVKMPILGKARPVWFVVPTDIYGLTRQIRGESAMIEALCNEVDKWIGELPINQPNLLRPKGPQNTEPEIFYYESNPISFKVVEGRVFVNATQMAKAFKTLPDEWLRLIDTIKLRDRLVEDGLFDEVDSQIIRVRGRYGATWMEQSLAVEYAKWLSADFAFWCSACIVTEKAKNKLPVKKESQITEKDTIPKTPKREYSQPQTFEEALSQNEELKSENKELRQEISLLRREREENNHKVEFYDDFIENRLWFKTSTLADELDTSSRRLNQFLVEKGIIQFEKRQWVARSQHKALQTEVRYYNKNDEEHNNNNNKKKATGPLILRWTKAGREYIKELWEQEHPKNDKI